MTIDADSGVLIRREGNRVLIACSNPDEPAGFNTAFDPDFPLRIAEPLEARFPAVAAAGLDLRRSWAGLYEVTPDHHAILGPVAGVPGFLVAGGFSGHGVMHAPAAGRAVAEMIVRGRSESVDVARALAREVRARRGHPRDDGPLRRAPPQPAAVSRPPERHSSITGARTLTNGSSTM